MLRVFTAFSAHDSQCLALNRIGVDYDLVGWSEIDRYAIKAHNALFPQYAERNYGDISRIDWANVPDFDLFTYSFPCTDISAAGQQKDFTEGSGTASASLWSRFSMASLVLLVESQSRRRLGLRCLSPPK